MRRGASVLFARVGCIKVYVMRLGPCVPPRDVRMVNVKMNRKCDFGGKAVNPVEYDGARKDNFR